MAHTSLQVCMDSSDWLQGALSEDISSGLDSSSSPSGECNMLAAVCSSRAGPPLMERRLRPPHDQNLKCPRCDSTHTKFCYYNNYSLSQPRYFCKTCRRYWTKGGTLRNIPVGGGCRKNKKSSTSKKLTTEPSTNQGGSVVGPSHLSFPEVVQFPPHHLANLMTTLGGASFMGSPIDLMESKYNNNDNGVEFGVNVMGGYNGMSTTCPFGMSSNDHIINDGHSGISFMDQRLLLPYDGNDHHHHHHDHDHQSGLMINDVKPNPRLLSLDQWQDQGSWTGLMGGFQPSTTNSFV